MSECQAQNTRPIPSFPAIFQDPSLRLRFGRKSGDTGRCQVLLSRTNDGCAGRCSIATTFG